MQLRGVLLDSGDTMIRPIGGRWNPRFDFEEVVSRYAPTVRADRFPDAFAEGQRFLSTSETTADRDDYHRVILRALGIPNPVAALLADLDRPLPGPVVEPFPEVRDVLVQLRALDVRMAVVSDTWPGLDHLYEQLGLRELIDVFVISAILGCRKPDPRMYKAGSDGLGLAPEECMFVDDDPALVEAAIALGYRGLAICRAGSNPPDDIPWIVSLDELLPVFRDQGAQ